MNITVRQCMIGETEWFCKLEGKYHYMGESHGAGDLVRLVFEEDGRPVALMTWAAARHGKLPRHLAADGKFVDEVVGLVSVVDAESGDVAAVAPASRKEGLLSAEWTGLWARSPLSDHQTGSAAKVSAKCSAGIG